MIDANRAVMEAKMARSMLCSIVLALPLLCWPQAAAAEKDNKEPMTTGTKSGGGSVDGFFEDVGKIFGGDDDDKREIDRLDGTENYAGIAAKRPLSLRLLHGNALGIVAYPGFAEYANQVLAKLLAAAPMKNLQARVYVVGSSNLNAGAMPCGAIAIYWGLIRSLRNEDELAFVLSHELGHIAFHHHDTDFFVDAQHYAVTSAAITDQLANDAGANFGFQFDTDGDLGRAVRLGRIAEKVSANLLLPSFTRGQEDVADRFGVDLMIRAGYNPAAILSFLTTLAAWETAQKAEDDKLRDAIGQHLEGRAVSANASTISAESLVEEVVALAETVADVASTPDHYPAVDRKKQVQKYMAAHYAKAAMSAPIAVPWEASATSKINKPHSQFRSADRAYRSLDAGRIAEAEKLASASVAGAMTSEGHPRFAFYLVRLAQGQRDKAKANLHSALKAPQPGVLVWQARIRMAEDEGRFEEAAALLDDARRRLDDPPALLPDRIRIYPRVGRRNEVTPLLLECQLRWRSMAEKCAAEDARLRI
jgi:beta-barrel assembly-enhancing protease